jgi:methionyl-tRNA formyltransferase
MKIGFFADGPWAHKAIERIISSDVFEIVFIVPRFDTQDPVLEEYARKLNTPFLPCQNVNDSEFISTIGKLDADIYVSMSFNQILKEEIILHSRLGFINCHAGALPFYRGRNPLNWVLINGESHFGITVHYVDKGIDTGDIVEQRLYPIKLSDNYRSLLDLAVVQCAEVLFSALCKIESGSQSRVKQTDMHPVGTYFGMRTHGDEKIDFTWTAKRFFDFVRALSNPGPGSRFTMLGEEYAIESSSLIHDAPSYVATIGEVVGRNDSGVVVKVGDSTILITRVRALDSPDAYIPRFKIGTRLT